MAASVPSDLPKSHRATASLGGPRSGLIALTLLASLGRPLGADYSPFRMGRVWEYQGKGVTQSPLRRDAGAYAPQTSFQERLRLTVLDMRTRADSTVITVEEWDSLYARKTAPASAPFSAPVLPLPDTVITRILTYVQRSSGLRLRQGDSLTLGHRDSADLFFPTVSTAPGPGSRPLTGLAAGYQGVEYGQMFEWRPAQLFVHPLAWYVDGIGLYGMRIRTSVATCDFPESRDLRLTALDGRPVDIGSDPPGSPLAKEARIACGIVNPVRRGGAGFVRREGGAMLDALGRNLPAAIPEP